MLFALSHTPQEGAGRSVGTVGCFVLTFRNRPLRSILRLPHFHAFGKIEHDIRGTHLKHELKQAANGREFEPHGGDTGSFPETGFDIIVD